MNWSKTFTIGLLFCSFLVSGSAKGNPQMITVFSDDYDAVWDATPIPENILTSYIGVPNVSGGVARGIGSGYSRPLYTWMVEPLVFTAETFEVTLRGQSGPSWPNSADVWLMDTSWGGHGQPAIGYRFTIYGESSNYRFRIQKYYGPGREQLASYFIGSTITDWHTYVVSRDAAGNWALTMDDATVSHSFMNPDLSYTDFAYIGTFLYRDQSALDYVEVKVPEPAIEAAIDIKPDTLDLSSRDKWVTCYIIPADDYQAGDIDVDTVKLENSLEVQHSDFQKGVLMVKFDRQELISYIRDVLGIVPPVPALPLTVTGEFNDGASFEGIDEIRVKDEKK